MVVIALVNPRKISKVEQFCGIFPREKSDAENVVVTQRKNNVKTILLSLVLVLKVQIIFDFFLCTSTYISGAQYKDLPDRSTRPLHQSCQTGTVRTSTIFTTRLINCFVLKTEW